MVVMIVLIMTVTIVMVMVMMVMGVSDFVNLAQIVRTLREFNGNVLVTTDTAGRALEVLLCLEQHLAPKEYVKTLMVDFSSRTIIRAVASYPLSLQQPSSSPLCNSSLKKHHLHCHLKNSVLW